jgi:hypothetical protein
MFGIFTEQEKVLNLEHSGFVVIADVKLEFHSTNTT